MIDGKVSQVAPFLLRGYRPASMRDLKTLNVELIVNVQSGIWELISDSMYEKESAHAFGMIEVNFPLSNWAVPNEDQIRSIIEIIESYREQKKTVYVHCKWGRDRTGYVIAAWRMVVQNYPFELAVEDLMAGGFRRWVYWYWLKSLRRFER